MKFTFEKELQKEEIQSVLEIGFCDPRFLFYLFHFLNPAKVDGVDKGMFNEIRDLTSGFDEIAEKAKIDGIELCKKFDNLNQAEFHFKYYCLFTEHVLNKIPISFNEFAEKFDLKYEKDFNLFEFDTKYDFVVMQKVLVKMTSGVRMECIDKINNLLNPRALFYLRISGQEKTIDKNSSEYCGTLISEDEIEIIKSKFTLVKEQKIYETTDRFYYDFLFRKID